MWFKVKVVGQGHHVKNMFLRTLHSAYHLCPRGQRSQMSRSKVMWVRVKSQIRFPEKGRWAHNNVKLLHSTTLFTTDGEKA